VVMGCLLQENALFFFLLPSFVTLLAGFLFLFLFLFLMQLVKSIVWKNELSSKNESVALAVERKQTKTADKRTRPGCIIIVQKSDKNA